MKKLYVGNISFSTSETELKEAFGSYTSIVSLKLITDRETGQSRGFAFIEMQDSAEAERAISEMDGKSLSGKSLRVNEARPQGERGSSSGRSSYGSRY